MNKEEKKVNRIWLFMQLICYLIVGWFLFSKMGYLPKILSMPLPEKMKKYSIMYAYSGYSFFDKYVLNYKKDVVKPNTLKKLDVFTNNNIIGTSGYYAKDENKYYIANSKYIIEFDAETKDKKVITDKNITEANNMTYTPVKYEDVYFKLQPLKGKTPRICGENATELRTPNLNNLIYDYFYDETIKGQAKRIDFQGFTEILNDNETKNISLEKLSVILWLTRYNQILSWNPETKSALYMYEDDTGRYFVKHTAGEKELRTFGPYRRNFSVDRFDENNVLCIENNKVYIFNVETQERRDITQLPEGISLIRYRIRDDKKICIIGMRKVEGKIWFYDEATNSTKDYNAQNDMYDLIIGTKGFFAAEHSDDEYSGRFFTIEMYEKEGE